MHAARLQQCSQYTRIKKLVCVSTHQGDLHRANKHPAGSTSSGARQHAGLPAGTRSREHNLCLLLVIKHPAGSRVYDKQGCVLPIAVGAKFMHAAGLTDTVHYTRKKKKNGRMHAGLAGLADARGTQRPPHTHKKCVWRTALTCGKPPELERDQSG